MRIYCKQCFEQGIRGGTSVYRLTPTLRPRWTAPQNYYILSPSHAKHAGSRTTVPAWMLEGCLTKLMEFLANDDIFMNNLTGEFESLVASDRGNEDLIRIRELETRKRELETRMSNGVEELLHWRDNPRIKEKLRKEIQSMDYEVSEIESLLKSDVYTTGHFDKTAQVNKWMDLFHHVHDARRSSLEELGFAYMSQFIDTFLIDNGSIEIKFNIDLLATITLPKTVTKSVENFECQLKSSTFGYSRKKLFLTIAD